MSMFRKVKLYGIVLLAVLGVTSCSDYLDVVPPEQPGLPDASKNYNTSLGFLYSCYGGIANPIGYLTVEGASDEWVLPPLWNGRPQIMTYDLNTSANIADGWLWGNYYRFVGQCHLFLQELPNMRGVSDEDKKIWEAEVNFLLGYYHMQTLILYGPCPITDKYIDPETSEKEYPGRYHFDYVTDWIVNKFDEAAAVLPPSYTGEKWGRATATIAKAMKARLLLYAASPLWNGSFPSPQWKNLNFETPGYGKDLVSLTYDKAKWERARKACQEALDFALSQGGCSLYTDEEHYAQEGIALPFVPGVDENTPEGKAFLKKVMLMRYLVTTRSTEGNREIIWGITNQGDIVQGSLPHRILRKTDGNYVNGWSGVSPVLNTSIEYFYTKNGKRPAHDDSFASSDGWFRSANIANRPGIINLNVNREPRFYAWFGFDGGDYGSKIANGSPLKIELRDAQKNGYNPELFNRDNNVTGYFSQKFVLPSLNYNLSGSDGGSNQTKPRSLVRLAELYLNLAECEAELDNVASAIENLNVVRNRAGVPDLTTADLSVQNIREWVKNERFIELWNEGHRYYDVRRWMIAPQTMGSGMRKGLNAYGIKNPTFEQFNTVKPVNQEFRWNNRMYLLPVFHIEVYKNPQMVQAPGY